MCRKIYLKDTVLATRASCYAFMIPYDTAISSYYCLLSDTRDPIYTSSSRSHIRCPSATIVESSRCRYNSLYRQQTDAFLFKKTPLINFQNKLRSIRKNFKKGEQNAK